MIQYALDATTALKLPEPTCRAANLRPMLEPGLLQANSQQHHGCRVRCHARWKKIVSRADGLLYDDVQISHANSEENTRGLTATGDRTASSGGGRLGSEGLGCRVPASVQTLGH